MFWFLPKSGTIIYRKNEFFGSFDNLFEGEQTFQFFYTRSQRILPFIAFRT